MKFRSPGHPHAGGEIVLHSGLLKFRVGPSPRGWGNQAGIKLYLSYQRAIPTRVGKSTT